MAGLGQWVAVLYLENLSVRGNRQSQLLPLQPSTDMKQSPADNGGHFRILERQPIAIKDRTCASDS